MGDARFLFVQSTTEQGGAETVLLNAFTASAELRARGSVAILGFGSGDLAQRLREAGASVFELRGVRLRNPVGVVRTVIALARAARVVGARVLVANGPHPQVYAGMAARVAHIRSAYLVHTLYRYPLLANHPIEALAIRGPCDFALANSEATREAVRRLRPKLRVDVIYPGTPVSWIDPTVRALARQEIGVTTAAIVFGAFGRLQRSKGQDVFIEAAAHVSAAVPSARFVLVGGVVFGLEPAFERELHARSRALGLGDQVIFTGQRRDATRLMAACDVVCHTARDNESFGMVLIEGMAQARPVIATRVGGPAEIIEDGVTGLLVAPNDVKGMAEAMLRLANDAGFRRAAGEAGLRRARDKFSATAYAESLVRRLDAVADRASIPAGVA